MIGDVIRTGAGIYGSLLPLKFSTGIAFGFFAALVAEETGFRAVREMSVWRERWTIRDMSKV